MNRKLGRRGFAALAGAMVVAGPVAAACSPGPSYEDWASTDGAAGRINLDAVQEAFKKSDSPTEFEKKVNEIYEGDALVLIRVTKDGENFNLEGFEDLNKNGTIDDASDDLLFSIFKENDQHELRGHGANGYYRRPFGAGDFLFTYLLISAMTPRGGYYYSTPRGRVATMSASRTNYRGSSMYRGQVANNSRYFNTQKSFAGSRYNAAGRNLGTSRQSYMSAQKSSGAFKSSGTGVRSSWGARSGRSGGFRGGGGALSIIGLRRGYRASVETTSCWW